MIRPRHDFVLQRSPQALALIVLCVGWVLGQWACPPACAAAFPVSPPVSMQDAQSTEPEGAKGRPNEVVVSPEAQAIHDAGYLFDGHNDLPWTMRRRANSSFDQVDISEPTEFHTDIPRLKQGGLKAQFWSVYVPASTDRTGNALLQTLEQIELVHAMVKRYPEVFEIARSADDVERIVQSGKIASMMGVEGGHSIQGSLSVLSRMHERGVRYMTLTHSKTLAWADSATDDAVNNGLSQFGKDVIREMNRVGILVDLSHVSDKTMLDALEVTRAPVIFSHSSVRAICDHPRNVPDEILVRLKDNGGVVMINFMSGYVAPTSELEQDPRARGTIHDVVDHVEHVINVVGIDHVGIGSDYDGVSRLPVGLEDVSTYPRITQLLLERGYDESQIHKILGGNVLRVLRESEQVAAAMQLESARQATLDSTGVQIKVSAGKLDRLNTPVRAVLPVSLGLEPGNYVLHLADDIKQNVHATLSPGDDKGSLNLDFVLRELAAEQSLEFELQKLDNNLFTGFEWAMEDGVSAKLQFNDRPVLQYQYQQVDNSSPEKRQETYKVYHHVYSLDGQHLLTKGPGGLFPHHRGIFFGFNRISYGGKNADVWHCNKGESQVHVNSFSAESARQSNFVAGTSMGENTALIEWRGQDDGVFAREQRTLRTVHVPGAQVIDFESVLQSAVAEPIKLDGDPQHAGVQFRASQFVPDNTKGKTFYIRPDGRGTPGKFRNWPNDKEHINLPWNALVFEVEGQQYTCVYLDHPENPKPARFSERDYGRFGSYFVYELTKESPLQVKYRFWIEEGELPMERIEQLQRDFVEPVQCQVEKR